MTRRVNRAGYWLAQRHGRPARLTRWMTERDRVYADIMDRGWHQGIDAFTQHYDTDVLDSSLLQMPPAGFVMPRDPLITRWTTAPAR